MNGNLTLIFIIWCKYYKKTHRLWNYLSCHSTLGRYIHPIYRIEPNLHISPSVPFWDLANFAGSIIISFFIAALVIRWFGKITALPRWTWLLLLVRYFSLLSLPPKLFPPYFAVTNLWVSRSLRHLLFLGKLLSGVCSKFLRDSMGNSYFKKDYSKGEVNAVEIAQIRLQKMKKHVAMAIFCC